MLTGLFSLIEGSLLEIFFLGAACGLVFLSTWVKSRGLLLVGTVAILGYIGYYTAEHFTDVVGWPIASESCVRAAVDRAQRGRVSNQPQVHRREIELFLLDVSCRDRFGAARHRGARSDCRRSTEWDNR